MKMTLNKPEGKEIIFFLSYGIYLIFNVLNTSFYAQYIFKYLNYVNYFCMFLLAVHIIVTTKTMKHASFAGMLLLGIVLIIALFGKGKATYIPFIHAFVFLYAGRNVPFNKIAKFSLVLTGIVLAFIVMSGYLGLIPNYIYISATRTRKFLGFRYALYGSGFFFNISALYICLYKHKIKWNNLFVLLLINGWFYLETNSRLSFGLSVALLTLAAIMKKKANLWDKHKMLCRAMIPVFIVSTFVSLYLVINYSNSVEWMRKLSESLGNRISLGHASMLRYGYSMLGQNINWVGSGLNVWGEKSTDTYLYVDNLYVQVLQKYGIFFLVLYVGLHTAVLIKCYRKKDYYLMVMFVFLAIHALIDDLKLYLYYNTFWFAIGTVVFTDFGKARAVMQDRIEGPKDEETKIAQI